MIGDGGHAKVIREVLRARYAPVEAPDAHIIAVGSNSARKRIAAETPGPFATLAHPSAIIARDAEIGEGTVIMAGVIIQPGVKIGRHCIINTKASIDHDCVIGDFVHIGPGCTLCGNVTVSEGKMVPAGTVLYQGATW